MSNVYSTEPEKGVWETYMRTYGKIGLQITLEHGSKNTSEKLTASQGFVYLSGL